MRHQIESVIEDMTCNRKVDGTILYHGSRKGINGDIAPIGSDFRDFGRGFYMVTTVTQALTTVCTEEDPRLYALELDPTGLEILVIDNPMDWAMLVAYNRGEMDRAEGTPVYEKYSGMTEGYDIVIGDIADHSMHTALSGFLNGTLTDAALFHILSELQPGRQYVAITQKACGQIRILEEKIPPQSDLALIRDMCVKERCESIKISERIEVEHRREGMYFDELLRGNRHG